MNPDDVLQGLQKGFRLTLGATATLLESVQDAQRRNAALEQLRTNPSQFAEELTQKGEATEQEARRFVDSLLAQQPANPTSPLSKEPAVSPALQADLQELTAQIAAMRAELEQLRQETPS